MIIASFSLKTKRFDVFFIFISLPVVLLRRAEETDRSDFVHKRGGFPGK